MTNNKESQSNYCGLSEKDVGIYERRIPTWKKK